MYLIIVVGTPLDDKLTAKKKITTHRLKKKALGTSIYRHQSSGYFFLPMHRYHFGQ